MSNRPQEIVYVKGEHYPDTGSLKWKQYYRKRILDLEGKCWSLAYHREDGPASIRYLGDGVEISVVEFYIEGVELNFFDFYDQSVEDVPKLLLMNWLCYV
jgi:hypothetical protein